jgi:SAM-dependent methyltransferase
VKEPLLGFGAYAGEAYRRRVNRALGLAPVKGKRALDLGCGDGYEALMLHEMGYEVDGYDLEESPQWKEISRRTGGKVRLRLGDASSVKGSGGYDLVYQKDMLHHTADPVVVLKQMAAHTRPGGQVLLVEANRWNPVFYLHLTLMEGHEHFSYLAMRRHLRAAGMGKFSTQFLEARVWPVNRAWGQRFFNALQDLIQALPFLKPVVCYHVFRWTRLRSGSKGQLSRPPQLKGEK